MREQRTGRRWCWHVRATPLRAKASSTDLMRSARTAPWLWRWQVRAPLQHCAHLHCSQYLHVLALIWRELRPCLPLWLQKRHSSAHHAFRFTDG